MGGWGGCPVSRVPGVLVLLGASPAPGALGGKAVWGLNTREITTYVSMIIVFVLHVTPASSLENKRCQHLFQNEYPLKAIRFKYILGQDCQARVSACSDMPLISQYVRLRKQDSDTGRWRVFTPLRAAGLAVEKGHKLSKVAGFWSVDQADLMRVRISGPTVQILENGRWRKASQCSLQLKAADADLALSIFRKQRVLFSDLHINLWEVDQRMPNRLGSYDLLGEFCGKDNHGVFGRLWVEVKVISESGFGRKLEDHKREVSSKLIKIREVDTSIDAALLVAARIQKNGRDWMKPKMIGLLFTPESGDWKQIAGSSIKVRGKANPVNKPALQVVWDEMEWETHPETQEKVGYFKHF